MVRDIASTPTASRAHPQWPDDEGSPGASSSSSPSNVILSHRQCPGVDRDIRSKLVAALAVDDEPEASNFIDDIAMSEAMWREQLEPVDHLPCRKRLRDKTIRRPCVEVVLKQRPSCCQPMTLTQRASQSGKRPKEHVANMLLLPRGQETRGQKPTGTASTRPIRIGPNLV